MNSSAFQFVDMDWFRLKAPIQSLLVLISNKATHQQDVEKGQSVRFNSAFRLDSRIPANFHCRLHANNTHFSFQSWKRCQLQKRKDRAINWFASEHLMQIII